MLWTYADRNADGTYRRLGGGQYDPVSDTYGQGAFNADDISRAAVVYLRHWRATGSTTSRSAAYQLLRGLTYLQTAGGPNAGNVVLWMQPDGTLNRSADPPESPDPSDSADSYWLARTLWALGEGYAAFKSADPRFASFLRDRLDARRRRRLAPAARPVRAMAPDRRDRRTGVADRAGRGRHRRGAARARGVRGGERGPACTYRSRPAGRGCRRDAGRHRPVLAVRRDPAVGAVPFGVARLGRTGSGRPRPRVRCHRNGELPRRGTRRHRLVHSAPADRRRAGERLAARTHATASRSRTAPSRGWSRC